MSRPDKLRTGRCFVASWMMKRQPIYDWHCHKGSRWAVIGLVTRCARRQAYGAARKDRDGQQPYQIKRVAPKHNQTLDFEQEMKMQKHNAMLTPLIRGLLMFETSRLFGFEAQLKDEQPKQQAPS